MTDPTEQTVLEALANRLLTLSITDCPEHYNPASEVDCMDVMDYGIVAGHFVETLGIDPDMSVDRLRADLAIAARARACASDERFDNVDGPDGRTFYTPERLLAYLLNGEQP